MPRYTVGVIPLAREQGCSPSGRLGEKKDIVTWMHELERKKERLRSGPINWWYSLPRDDPNVSLASIFLFGRI